MMQKIRPLVFAMSILLVASVFAACGQGGQTVPPTATPEPTIEQTPTPTPEPTPAPTPRPILTIRSIFPGAEPVGLPAVFEKLNERLASDIYGKLELSWAPEEGFDGAISVAVASGAADFAWIKSSQIPDYVKSNSIAPLDELVASFGKPILDNTNPALLDLMKVNGKLMAIPSAGYMPLCDTGNVFIVREDLRQKHNLPEMDSITHFEQYLKAIKENEAGVVPVAAGNAAFAIMKAYGPEEVLAGTGNSVAVKINADGTVTCMNLQDAEGFKGAAARVRAWYRAGWLPKDIPAVKDGGALLTTGTAAATGGKAMSALALQEAMGKVPGAELTEVPVFGEEKYLFGDVGNALCLAAGSKNPEVVVQFWAWALASQDNYDLFCYGVEHVNFEITNGRITMLNDSYGSFPARVFDNMNFRRFPAGVSDSYIEKLRRWNDGAAVSPLMGFAFDPAPVKNEIAKVKAVYATYGPAIQTGSIETAPLLKEFAAKMKAAGQDKILAEAQQQINTFLGK